MAGVSVNNLIGYLDLQSAARSVKPEGQASGKKRRLPVFPQYLALVLGIAAQPYLTKYQATGKWILAGWLGWLIFAVVVALTIFPYVYKKSFDPGKPLFVQWCAIFSAGMGWQSLLATSLKAVAVR